MCPNEDPIPTIQEVNKQIKAIYQSLEKDTIYKCLVVGLGDYGIKASKNSFFISQDTDPSALANRFISLTNGVQMKYQASEFTSWKLAVRK